MNRLRGKRTGKTSAPDTEEALLSCMADDSLKPGDTVLIQGTGGVSIFALVQRAPLASIIYISQKGT
jgi:3-oxoacyl-[acyl-carrier-protein] synthase III